MKAERKASEAEAAEAIQCARASTQSAECRTEDLQRRLGDLRAHLRLEEEVEERRGTALRSEVSEARVAVLHAEGAEQKLRAELVECQRSKNETDRKALDLARELFETSQSLVWLREDVGTQKELRCELGEERQACQFLRRSLEAMEFETAWSSHSRDLAIPQSATSCNSAAGVALREMRNGQVRAVSEALQCAWEAEAHERRVVDQQLGTLKARWEPLQRQLVQLSRLASRWREALHDCGELPNVLPSLPPSSAWDDEIGVGKAFEMLQVFLKALAEESLRRIARDREKVTVLEQMQQKLSDRAVAAITRKRVKAEKLKIEKVELLQQLAQIANSPKHEGASSAPSSTPRSLEQAPNKVCEAAGQSVATGTAAVASSVLASSSMEQMFESWDEQRGQRIRDMQHQINELQQRKPRLRSALLVNSHGHAARVPCAAWMASKGGRCLRGQSGTGTGELGPPRRS